VSALRVIVVSDDPLARAGLHKLLAEQTDLEVAGENAGDDSVTQAFQAYQPDAVLWDLGWGDHGLSWRDPLAELIEAGGKVVALISEASQTAELRSAGVRGLLGRDAPPDRISAAVAAVQQGLLAVEPRFELPLMAPPDELPLEALTDREREVLQLMAEGLSNKSIAYRLKISEHTVKFHVNGILRKLGAQSRTDAVVRATRLGWILL
jgi:DNA-binding NarL/FixJ family response regulator